VASGQSLAGIRFACDSRGSCNRLTHSVSGMWEGICSVSRMFTLTGERLRVQRMSQVL
jgi:hypothetical protein